MLPGRNLPAMYPGARRATMARVEPALGSFTAGADREIPAQFAADTVSAAALSGRPVYRDRPQSDRSRDGYAEVEPDVSDRADRSLDRLPSEIRIGQRSPGTSACRPLRGSGEQNRG